MTIDWVSSVLGVAGALTIFWLGQGLLNAIQTRRANRLQVAGHEQEVKRDTLADRDALLDRVLKRLGDVEARVGILESAVIAYSDHIDVLEAFVWKVYRGEAEPPPPPRPAVNH